MDLNQIKNKLDSINNVNKSNTTKEKVDYTKVFWRPTIGKHQIRIVPSLYNKENPFKEVFIHYGFTKFPMLALTNWGEADPIIELANKLRQTKEKENWFLAKKLEPKMRVFAPVLVRGEEEKGIRLWEFGKSIYKDLLGFAADEDYGDFTDIQEGRDFTIEGVEDKVGNKPIVSCSIRIKPKPSPISDNAALLDTFLNTQPNIMEINTKFEYDFIKEALRKWLNPEEGEQSASTPSTEEPKTEAKGKYTASTSATTKFDNLFEKGK